MSARSVLLAAVSSSAMADWTKICDVGHDDGE